jgi:hypothetical protein
MPSNYTGNPIATQAPSAAPDLTNAPVGRLPTDGDTFNVSSILQGFKVSLDFIAFLQSRVKPFQGVRTWVNTTTYVAGDAVIYSDGHTYRVIAGQSPVAETLPTDASKWERWGYSDSELIARIAAIFTPSISTNRARFFLPGGGMIQIEFLLQTSGELPTSGTVEHTWKFAFANNFVGAIFQPSHLSGGHVNGMPSIIVHTGTVTGCSLTLVPQASPADTGYVLDGWLISFGN